MLVRHMARRDRRNRGKRKQDRRGGRGGGRQDGPGDVGRGAILGALKDQDRAISAGALATAMGLEGDLARQLSRTLRELARGGDLLEVRPGRFALSGTAGEYPVTIESDGEDLRARFDEGRVLEVHPAHSLGTQPGDQAVAMVDDAGRALIVRVQRRFGREIPGSLDFRHGQVRFVPDNRREGELRVRNSLKQLRRAYSAGDRVAAELLQDDDGTPAVQVTRVLSQDSPEVADFEQVRLQHDLPGPFPDEVEAAAQAAPDDFALGGRRDLRDQLLFTIDPESAKDFDDAISIEEHQGGWRIGVHIADVSHFVRSGQPIDDEALLRGTSIYLVNRVIPMLPERLSNGLCSLVPGEDRYALSVFIDLDKRLRVRHVEPVETLIRSRQRLSYEQALAMIEERESGDYADGVVDAVRRCHQIAQQLRQQRERNGALNIFSIEQEFVLDADGQPIEVRGESGDVAHQLIEEFMLLANCTVAAWLDERHSECVYRVHGEPDEERLQFFAGVLEAYGISNVDLSGRQGLRRVLERLAKEPPTARLVLNFLCLRSFEKAHYSVDNIGHYALAFEHYLHFTSPIRRYPDLIVHRLVKRQLGLPDYQGVEHRRSNLDAFARQCSFLERRAEMAERDLKSIKGARYLDRRMGEVFTGVVTAAMPVGLFIRLLETGLEGMIPLRELGDDFYNYDAERMALIGSRSGRVLTVGLELDVMVVAVDIPRAEVTLTIA